MLAFGYVAGQPLALYALDRQWQKKFKTTTICSAVERERALWKSGGNGSRPWA
jgi:hypothetical protein